MPAKFKEIPRSNNLYEEVLKSLKGAVLEGIYKPGTVLPSETELATQFGVSRPVVREALRALQSKGFVEIRRGAKGGATVRRLDKRAFTENLSDFIRLRKVTVDHIFQARKLVEPEVARLCALSATESDLDALESIASETRQNDDPELRIRLNLAFHRQLARACSNPLYTMLMESLMEITEGLVRTIKPMNRNLHDDAEHSGIVEALRERNPEKAAELVRCHTARLGDELRLLEAECFQDNSGKKTPGLV